MELRARERLGDSATAAQRERFDARQGRGEAGELGLQVGDQLRPLAAHVAPLGWVVDQIEQLALALGADQLVAPVGHHARAIEARVDLGEVPDRTQQQARADHEHHGERDLHHDEGAPDAAADATGRALRAAFLQRGQEA